MEKKCFVRFAKDVTIINQRCIIALQIGTALIGPLQIIPRWKNLKNCDARKLRAKSLSFDRESQFSVFRNNGQNHYQKHSRKVVIRHFLLDEISKCLAHCLKRFPTLKFCSVIESTENKLHEVFQHHSCQPGATSIRRTFKSSKNEKPFNASKEFHISDYVHLVIFCGDYHICCMARSLRSFRQVAILRHGHMARRSASLLHLGH